MIRIPTSTLWKNPPLIINQWSKAIGPEDQISKLYWVKKLLELDLSESKGFGLIRAKWTRLSGKTQIRA